MNSPLVRWLLDLERIPAEAEGLRLAWERSLPGWAWTIILFAAVLFAIWSYAQLEGDRRGRGILAVVRGGILLLVTVLLCGPLLELPRETVEPDWVLVLSDRSESMQIADAPGAGTGQRRQSREEQLHSLLTRTSGAWAEMQQRRRVLWLGFHDSAFDLSGGADSAAGGSSGVGDGSFTLPDLGEPTGRRTSIAAAIEQALQKAAARPISGIVLFSDGRTIDPPSRSLVRRLQADQIPVFTVPLGSRDPLGDLAVRRVDAPRRAFVRDKVPVVVELDRFGEAVRDLGATVRLVDEATGETLDEQPLQPGGGDSVTLTAEPGAAGDATWRVEVRTATDDLVPDNNIRPFTIELVDRPLRVLYVDGYPRWEFRYLRWLLIREQSVQSSIMLLSADRDFAQEGNTPITRLPRSPEEFAEFDVIILGDVPGTFFSASQLEMIRDHVAERGAGLLWIGGERWTPASFTGTAAVLADLLPIRGALSLPAIGRPVTIEPTPLADRLGVLRLVSAGQVGWPRELADPSFRWSRLQWAQRILPTQLKPTAQPLAVTTEPIGGAQLPVVIHMRYGAGQTIYVATDEIWRWRYGRGDLLPEQFWVQMIRMLGRETLSGGDTPALLEVEPRRLAVGQPMQITLRLLDARLAELDARSIRATIEDAAGARLAEVDLRQVDGAPGEYVATILPDVAGTLRVRVQDALIAAQPLLADAEVFNPENELRRPETDHDLLAALSRDTGGRVLETASDIERLNTTLLRDRSVTTPNPLTERLWDTPLAFLLVLLLLASEWVGRKALRLA